MLVWLALLAGLALGAALVTMYEPTSGAAAHERIRLRRAAESAATLALLDLAARLDWSQLPGRRAGVAVHRRRTGAAALGWRRHRSGGRDAIGGPAGAPTACDDATIAAVTDGRPWGARNPRWRLFVQLPLSRGSTARRRSSAPATSWRGSPTTRPTTTATRPPTPPTAWPATASLLVRGAAFAAGGAVAEVEALVAQPCRRSGLICPGIRVQSWGTVGEGVP